MRKTHGMQTFFGLNQHNALTPGLSVALTDGSGCIIRFQFPRRNPSRGSNPAKSLQSVREQEEDDYNKRLNRPGLKPGTSSTSAARPSVKLFETSLWRIYIFCCSLDFEYYEIISHIATSCSHIAWDCLCLIAKNRYSESYVPAAYKR